jgi:hypothetical protein
MGRWTILPSGRDCPACGATVSRLDDRCPACDAKLVPEKPFYIYAIGALLVGLLFLGLGDFGALGRFFRTIAEMAFGIARSFAP